MGVSFFFDAPTSKGKPPLRGPFLTHQCWKYLAEKTGDNPHRGWCVIQIILGSQVGIQCSMVPSTEHLCVSSFLELQDAQSSETSFDARNANRLGRVQVENRAQNGALGICTF